MRIKNNATRKAVKTIILITFLLASSSSNHYQLKNGRRHKLKLKFVITINHVTVLCCVYCRISPVSLDKYYMNHNVR